MKPRTPPATAGRARGHDAASTWTLRGALLLGVLLLPGLASLRAADIDDATLRHIAEGVFANEASGDPRRLLWWNPGERFLSLGIGHFIWFPAGVEEGFVESFPALLHALVEAGVQLPAWLRPDDDCPWPDRATFLAGQAAGDARIEELRQLLLGSLEVQARVLVERLRGALPAILDAAPEAARERLRQRYNAIEAVPGGQFALVDYVNFKGEGVHPGERYRGRGWGLAQVLAAMHDDGDVPALDRFADAAARVLTARVAASAPERGEARWLDGWLARVARYRGQ